MSPPPSRRSLRAIAAVEAGSARVLFLSGSQAAVDAVLRPADGGVADAEGHALTTAELPHSAAREGRSYPATELRIALDGAPANVIVEVAPARDADGGDAGVCLVRVEPKGGDGDASARRFLTVATHELRSPITSLQLDLERLRRRLSHARTVDGPAVAKEMERALRQVTRLTTLIQNLLDVSRMSSGTLVVRAEEGDLSAIVTEMVETLRPQAQAAGTDLVVSTCPSLVGAWDRVRLEQVLHNLVTNAIKYGRSDAPIEVHVLEHEGSARIVVRDHGRGIAEEDRARVFEPFERAAGDEHDRSVGPSLGLGLTIVREIVAAHGGTVTLETTPGHGTSFVVDLPVHAPTDPTR